MNKKTMSTQTPVNTATQLPIYKKALEICNLSFRLRTLYDSKEPSTLCSSTKMLSDHHLESLVLTAIGLPQTIAKATVSKDMFAHHGFSNYIQTSTKQVRHHLRMLRRHRPLPTSQCSALMGALKEFGRLHQQWTILQLNKN